jgi:hypothetical protein
MKKSKGQDLRNKFLKLQNDEKKLCESIGDNIRSLVVKYGGSIRKGIIIEDGPTRVSAWDDQVNEVVVGVTSTHIIIDEANNTSSVQFSNVSTETLVDVLCALEAQINDNQIVIENYFYEVR